MSTEPYPTKWGLQNILSYLKSSFLRCIKIYYLNSSYVCTPIFN